MSKPKCCNNKKTTKDLSQTVNFLKIIAEENRLKILCLLRDGEHCVCEIWPNLDLSQNLVSHHLKVLRDFKLIESRKEGLKVFYFLNKKEISKYANLLNHYLQSYGK